MDIEIAKEFAEMQRKLNNMQQQMDAFSQMLHAQSNTDISLNSGGITEIATIIDTHNQAITELGKIIGGKK